MPLRKQKELGVPFERVFFPTFSLYVSVNRARTMELVYQFTIRTATHVCVRIISREGIARQVRPVFIMSRAPTGNQSKSLYGPEIRSKIVTSFVPQLTLQKYFYFRMQRKNQLSKKFGLCSYRNHNLRKMKPVSKFKNKTMN